MKKENKCSNFLDYKVIGQEVRNRRLAKGYTQKDLAKKNRNNISGNTAIRKRNTQNFN